MKFSDKQLKYSIRKFSIGVASVAIGAVYLSMGAHVAHAGEITPSSEQHTRVTGTGKPDSDSSETETKTVTRTIKYVDASDESNEVSTTVTQTVTLERKKGTEEWTTGKWEAKTAPTVDGYDVSGNNTVEEKEVTSLTIDETVLVYYSKKESALSNSSSTSSTRGRRVRREAGDAPTGETSGNSTGTETTAGSSTGNNEVLNSALTERKGATVQQDQPGVSIPTGDELGANDPNAHLKFDDPKESATVEEMWKIIKNMPDDFQNNERSYLRNMDTLGDNLRFDENGNVTTDPNGAKLQPGEIREISSFGGWKAIMKKDGTTGKFAVGMKNKEGYFTGWYTKDGKREEGGMLGSDALDRVYLHEQALDRRFKYMLMLAKGRTIANKEDKAQDDSEFDIKTANNKFNKENLNNLPVKEKEDILQHSPNIEGFNGIEKTFTAFSTKYGSRLKIDFVTGYISDYEGSKGTYRIVVKAIKKGDNDGETKEETIYDHTINRIDGVVENEERYSQGVDLKGFNKLIKQLLTEEHEKKVKPLAEARYKEQHPEVKKPKFSDYKYLMPIITKELAEKDKGAVTYELPINQDELQEGKGKLNNKFKEGIPFTVSYATVANKLNNSFSKELDSEVQPNSPIWVNSTEKNSDGIQKGKDPDRVYKILDFVLPTAKKIIYHADTDQLELQTDPEKVAKHRKELNDRLATKEADLKTATDKTEITKLKKEISALKAALGSTNAYTYMEARNGSQEAKILGSHMEATEQPSTIEETEYNRIKTNELAANEKDGLSKFTAYFVEKEKVKRSNVLPDAELSKKITEEIGGDEDKLGKGGYFSTGDISLDKDVVAYKIQVFAENEKRVGVNKQSPRLQYNLPILADFSVIQDTVEASKEVTTRIITKLREQGKITEDQEKKIKEEIKKSKKTSELKSQLSGDVKVKYQDVSGNVLTLDNTKEHQKETDLGKKGEDGTYLAVDSGLRYTDYDVTDKKLDMITTSDGKRYRLKRSLDDGTLDDGRLKASNDERGTISASPATVTFVYEEYTPPVTGKGVVHFKKKVSDTKTEKLTGYDDITLEGEVGKEFSTDSVNSTITKLKSLGYDIVTNEFETKSKTIDSQTDADGQEPSQVFNVVVKERITTDTETKTVTRTIKYVKIDDSTGTEVEVENAQAANKKTVEFTRNLTINLVTGLTTNGPWSGKQTFEEVKTPVLTGYIADKAKVESTDVTVDSTDIVEKVVYRKIGSWVPKVPGEKIPTPIRYPNDPNDATKAKYPDYPKTPENPGETPNPQPGTPEKPQAPVIPYVEGYVPKVPIDPTKPVGADNPLKPLVPIDSNDSKKGYKVPELPQDPKKDTVIEYKPNPQKILIKVVNVTTGEEVELPNEKLEFNGVSDQLVTSEDKGKVDKKIESLKQRGYIVSTKNPITETTKYDTKDDSNQKEPTQTYKIVVNEPVTKDTEVRKVTRTIKYVKIDVQDNQEVTTELNTDSIKKREDKVEFSRDTTTSLATGLTKIGAWDTETKELSKVNTPVLNGYLASVASVENKSVSPDTESYEVTVVYRKIGSWVPKIPDGVTPPTGTDITPVPYPNDPDDPTKPKNPEYPETPGGNETPGTPEKRTPPVIPYIPGYTPKIGEEPLKPVDPNNPEKGYKVPPVPEIPNDPKTDTPIEYAADSQKAVVKVYNVKDNVETELTNDKLTMSGKTDEVIPTQSLKDKIEELKKRGYIIDEEPLKNGEKFDNQKDSDSQDPTQVFKLKVHEKLVPITPPTDDKPLEPGKPIDPDVPVVPNTPVDPKIPTWTVELINKVKNVEITKEVTRTINYVDESGAKVTYTVNGNETTESKTDKVTFTREAKINVVTGEITYGKWKAVNDDTTFEAVTSPVVKGYILKANQGSQNGLVVVGGTSVVASTNLTETSENQNVNVVYTKLGSWIPTPPTGVTPPKGENFNPRPYPNDPDDPTKPGTPTETVPNVPGYTPMVPTDPTKPVNPNTNPLKPLVPVDPEHPEKGYKVPDLPKTPGTDTPITYEGNPQKILIKVVNVTTGVEVPLDNEKLEFNGKSGETVKESDKNSVDAKITSLRNRGYIVDTANPITATTKYDTESDEGKQEPTQTYKLVVREKISIDKESTTVIRTIKYVKIDVQDGNEVRTELNTEKIKTKVDKVEFSRNITTNVTTGLTEIGAWNHAKQDFSKVDTPVLEGYLANKVSVPSKEVTPESASIEEVVEYRKIGSWIPNVPGGKTPIPIPYPNDPDDPTKPKNPEYPETPGGNETPGTPEKPTPPVIPYVPGYTPKTPDGNPLVPVDPNNPEKGYKVPPVPKTPNDPKENTQIEYVADTQKALVKVYSVKDGVKTELPNDSVRIDNGKTDAVIPTNTVEAKIKELETRGYTVDNKDLLKDKKFDNQKDSENGEPTQVFELLVRERTSVDTETKPVTRTIKYVKIDNQNGVEVEVEHVKETNTKTVEFTREITLNLVKGTVENGKWSEKQTLEEVKTPVLKGYIADRAKVESREVTGDSTDIEEKVVYRKIGSWIPNVPGGKTPTPIPYPNDPDDPTKPKNPEYPETPGGNETPGTPEKPTPPVIPYVPGYTPKTPDGNPLVPVDPNNPEKGYKVPPVPKTPNDPKENTQIEYVADTQKAVIKFVVVGEDGKETELETSRITVTGKTGEKIPTENFNDTLKKLTGDPVNNGDYELEENPLKDGATFDKVKDEEGKDPSQVFTVKLRQIYVIPPTPRIVERRSGNTVEVDVPNKDADTLSITFTKRNSTEKETIVTKKDKDGTWKIEKSPVGVTINPTNGRVYIPSEQVQPNTWVDTQTKHKYKQSKIVSVMPNILDIPKFEGTTEWIDVNGNVLRPTEDGLHEKGRIANHVWLESRLEGNKVTHIFFAGSPSVDNPESEYKITIWIDEAGNPLKPDQPGTHEAGDIPGYRFMTTTTTDGVTVHRFKKIIPENPNRPTPESNHITIWVDENGKPLKPEKPGTHEAGTIPGYRLITTVTKDGVTIHKFKKITPVDPNRPTPDNPTPELPNTPKPEEPNTPTSVTTTKVELPNTGTATNGFFTAEVAAILAGLGILIPSLKKKETEE